MRVQTGRSLMTSLTWRTWAQSHDGGYLIAIPLAAHSKTDDPLGAAKAWRNLQQKKSPLSSSLAVDTVFKEFSRPLPESLQRGMSSARSQSLTSSTTPGNELLCPHERRLYDASICRTNLPLNSHLTIRSKSHLHGERLTQTCTYMNTFQLHPVVARTI